MSIRNILSLEEAIVVALIHQPNRTATFEDVSSYIRKRNLCNPNTIEKKIKEVKLKLNKSPKSYANLFENVGLEYIRLSDTLASFPMQFYLALEALLNYDEEFYNPDLKELSVVDKSYGDKKTRKIKMNPADIVCILSINKSRKKTIYYLNRKIRLIEEYELNSQEFNFKSLCEYIDPLNNYLTQVAKSAIVNVSFFEPEKKKLLKYNNNAGKTEAITTIQLSDKEQGDLFLQNFTIVKAAYNRRIILQKTTLILQKDMGL
jgi:hypothetical protein